MPAAQRPRYDVIHFSGGVSAVRPLYLTGAVIPGEYAGFGSADGVWSVGPAAHGGVPPAGVGFGAGFAVGLVVVDAPV